MCITKRIIWLGILPAIALLGLFNLPIQTQGAVNSLSLVTCKNTQAVYFLAEDGKRYVFPNEGTYFTHYQNFDTVREISCEDLSSLPIGGNVPYLAGTRMLKIPSVPTVYAVEPEGVLRAINSEEQAIALYGNNWASRVDDLSEAFFPNYTLGEILDPDEIPKGTIIEDDGDLFMIDSMNEAILLNDLQITFPVLFENRLQSMDIETSLGSIILFNRNPNTDRVSRIMNQSKPILVPDENIIVFDDIQEINEPDPNLLDPTPISPITVDLQSGNYFFTPNVIIADSGAEVTINFAENNGTHTFTIDELNVNTFITKGSSISFTADLPPGEYLYYCNIGNHRQLGMEGTLIIN